MPVRTDSATSNPVAFSLALGTLAGAAMIVTLMMTSRGPMVFIPYTALVLATALYLRFGDAEMFLRRFGMALGAFMFASLILYVFIGTRPGAIKNMSLSDHSWRIGLMLAIGSALSASLAQLFRPRAP